MVPDLCPGVRNPSVFGAAADSPGHPSCSTPAMSIWMTRRQQRTVLMLSILSNLVIVLNSRGFVVTHKLPTVMVDSFHVTFGHLRKESGEWTVLRYAFMHDETDSVVFGVRVSRDFV